VARQGWFLFNQVLAFAFLVGFPALGTAIAPVSWIKFERREDKVSAHAKTCLLFVVPYKTVTVDPVTGISDRFVGGTVRRERRSGPSRETRSEDQGYLVIQGIGQSAEVPVTPFNLDSVVEHSEAFLNEPQAKELKLFVVANWKFSILMGGLLSLMTVIYILTWALGGVIKVIHLVQWTRGVPPERRLFARHLKE